MLFAFIIAQTGSFIPSFCCQTQKIDGFKNFPLKIDGFGRTHQTHANATICSQERAREIRFSHPRLHIRDGYVSVLRSIHL